MKVPSGLKEQHSMVGVSCVHRQAGAGVFYDIDIQQRCLGLYARDACSRLVGAALQAWLIGAQKAGLHHTAFRKGPRSSCTQARAGPTTVGAEGAALSDTTMT